MITESEISIKKREESMKTNTSLFVYLVTILNLMVIYPLFVFAQPSGLDVERGSFIQDFDKNNDGKVSMEEFPGPDMAFNRLDKNSDGFIDESEAPKGPPPRIEENRY